MTLCGGHLSGQWLKEFLRCSLLVVQERCPITEGLAVNLRGCRVYGQDTYLLCLVSMWANVCWWLEGWLTAMPPLVCPREAVATCCGWLPPVHLYSWEWIKESIALFLHPYGAAKSDSQRPLEVYWKKSSMETLFFTFTHHRLQRTESHVQFTSSQNMKRGDFLPQLQGWTALHR